MGDKLIKSIIERESFVREFALEAKRDGFKVIALFEETGVLSSELEDGKSNKMNLERFMHEGEVLDRQKSNPYLKMSEILNLEDQKVIEMLDKFLTAKDVLQQYSYEKNRIAILEFDKHCIERQELIKITNHNPSGAGIGLEDKCLNRIEKLNDIDKELTLLKFSTGRVEKALELIRDANEIGCDALLLKYVHNDSYDAIALALNCSRRTVIYKLKEVEGLFERILK